MSLNSLQVQNSKLHYLLLINFLQKEVSFYSLGILKCRVVVQPLDPSPKGKENRDTTNQPKYKHNWNINLIICSI